MKLLASTFVKYIFLSLFVTLASGFSNEPTKILFIGNSYTFTYSMPSILSEIISENGDKAMIETVAMGGYYLKNHLENPETIRKINKEKWDIVIIQEQSQLPALSDDIVKIESYPYLTSLDSLINLNDVCTKKYLYMTWGRKFGDSTNCTKFPKLSTYEGMDRELRLRYLEYSNKIAANIVPVGLVWNYINSFYPDLELYSKDNSHPSQLGAITTAYTFYSFLFNKNPFYLKNYKKIDSISLSKIKKSIYEVKRNFKIFNEQPIFETTILSLQEFGYQLVNTKFSNVYKEPQIPLITLNALENEFIIKPQCLNSDSTFFKRYVYINNALIIDNLIKVYFDEDKKYLNFELVQYNQSSKYSLIVYDSNHIKLNTYYLGMYAINIETKYLPNHYIVELEINEQLEDRIKFQQ
ncbi:MAG TPA: hypothetical protein PLE30_08495 [Candidatus Kapabacteria bacterium]|nr:hypothetical protein [Candidatus Kapabacteria bacterium]